MEIIKFDWLGLHLQEPMAMVTNGMLSLFCFYAFWKLRKWESEANKWWRLFYLTFGISTFFGIGGHLFFQYFGYFGKYPCWFFGALANVCAAKAMISFSGYTHPTKISDAVIWIKSIVLLALAFATQKFLFVTIDAIVTYIAYTGIFGYILVKRGVSEMKFMVTGVLVLLPSAFIFLLKINPHRWLNKDDLSHLFMLGCIVCFAIGMNAWGKRTATHS